MSTPQEIYDAEEALRGITGNETTSVKYARIQHFVGTQGNSNSIRSQVAIIKDPTSTKAQRLAAADAIRRLVNTRDSYDTLLRDRLLAVDPTWQARNLEILDLVEPPPSLRGCVYNSPDLERIINSGDPAFAAALTLIQTTGKNDGTIARPTRKVYGALDYIFWNPGPVVNKYVSNNTAAEQGDVTQTRDDSNAIAYQALLAVVGPEADRAAHRAKAIEGLDIYAQVTSYEGTGQSNLESSWAAHNYCIAIDLLGLYTHPMVACLRDVHWPLQYWTQGHNWVQGMATNTLMIALLTHDSARWTEAKDQFCKVTRASITLDGTHVDPMYSRGLSGTPMTGNTKGHWRSYSTSGVTSEHITIPGYTLNNTGIFCYKRTTTPITCTGYAKPGRSPEDGRDPGHLCMSLSTMTAGWRTWANVEGAAAIPQDITDRIHACITEAAFRYNRWYTTQTQPNDPIWEDGNSTDPGGASRKMGWLQCRRWCTLAGKPIPADLAAICARTEVKNQFGYLNMTLAVVTDAVA